MDWRDIDNLIRKCSPKLYFLIILKRAGVNEGDSISVYKTVLRPCLEYAAPVWHSSLPGYLSDGVEDIQKRVCKIVSPETTYSDALIKFGLHPLSVRRDNICQKFWENMQHPDHKLNYLVPKSRNDRYHLRPKRQYTVPTVRAKTNRLTNSFSPWCISNF